MGVLRWGFIEDLDAPQAAPRPVAPSPLPSPQRNNLQGIAEDVAPDDGHGEVLLQVPPKIGGGHSPGAQPQGASPVPVPAAASPAAPDAAPQMGFNAAGDVSERDEQPYVPRELEPPVNELDRASGGDEAQSQVNPQDFNPQDFMPDGSAAVPLKPDDVNYMSLQLKFVERSRVMKLKQGRVGALRFGFPQPPLVPPPPPPSPPPSASGEQ